MFSLFLVAGQNLPGNILSRLLLCEQTLKCNRGRQSRASRSRSTKVCAVTAVCQWICLLTMPCGAGSCLVRVPSFKSFACSTMRLCGCICCNPQSRKAFKQRDKCKGVCECGVTGAAKAWLVQCIPCDTTKPIVCTVTLELEMSSLVHRGHVPNTTSDATRCSTPYPAAAAMFCEHVRSQSVSASTRYAVLDCRFEPRQMFWVCRLMGSFRVVAPRKMLGKLSTGLQTEQVLPSTTTGVD